MKKILFVSQLCSPRLANYIYKTSKVRSGQAAPKFYRLLADGLAMHENNCTLEMLSVIPISTANHSRRFWNITSEVVGNIKFNYVPTVNMSILRNIIVFIYSFFKIFFWCLFQDKRNKVIICDVLGLSVSLASVAASKLSGTKIIGILTDLPKYTLMDSRIKKGIKHTLYYKGTNTILNLFDGYIVLTEQMNNLVNVRNKPYIVMEGLVDLDMEMSVNSLKNKANKRILLYAGGLYEKFGVKKMIEAFMLLDGIDLQLSIYGSGEMESDMQNFMNLDKRIIYYGVVPNYIIVQKEIEATILINPRPSNEEFTKYSFPSKNMEYMVSGTPIVTTLLPGMPKEYIPFVYLFENETNEGYYLTLKYLINKSREELHNFGCVAKQFVLENKSNFKQAERILLFTESF